MLRPAQVHFFLQVDLKIVSEEMKTIYLSSSQSIHAEIICKKYFCIEKKNRLIEKKNSIYLSPIFFTEAKHWTVLFFYICAISLKMSKTKTISETLLQNSYYASKNNQSNIFLQINVNQNNHQLCLESNWSVVKSFAINFSGQMKKEKKSSQA